MRRVIVGVAAVTGVAAVLFAGPARAGGGGHCPEPLPQAGAGTVLVLDSCFAPADQQISTGETVTFDASQATALHTVSFRELSSGDIAGSFTARFDQPGTFAYACAYHPGMVGSITVTGVPASTSSIVPLSQVQSMKGAPVKPAGFADKPTTAQAPAEQERAGANAPVIGWDEWWVVALGLALVALVSASAATIAVRVARR